MCVYAVISELSDEAVELFVDRQMAELARFMGTSVEQIDRTYGHLLPDSLDRTRQALDSFVAATPRADAAETPGYRP